MPGRRRSGPIVALAGAVLATVILIGGVAGVTLLSRSSGTDPIDDAIPPSSGPGTTAQPEPRDGADGAPVTTTGSPVTPVPGGRLEQVLGRGVVRCGVNGALPYFSVQEADGTFTGFDVDFCRVVAAAVLGDAAAVEFVPLTAAERFVALQTDEIDVLIRNTTQTASRSGELGVEFPFTTFFDGQTVMAPAASGITEAHVILQELISSEPLGPAVVTGDSQWAQAVEWAVMATVQAWEVGLDSTNVGTYDGSDPTSLIISGQSPFDPGLGLQPSYARLVVEQVGNYEEIYDANFGDSGLALEGSANDLARNGGLMFAPPLR